ncbi:MAG: hypothetical protein GX969_05060 [Firmicutes bacterium]|nr:hypothetical protein [Bacillota bacterium]
MLTEQSPLIISLACGTIALCFAALIKMPCIELLKSSGLIQRNYAGSIIPTSTGIIFAVSVFPAAMITVKLFILTGPELQFIFPYLLLVSGSSFAGLIDDAYGLNSHKGLIGHFKASMSKRMPTTGVVKAMIIWIITLISLYLSVKGRPVLFLLFDTALVGLFANFMNLLDVRPARSAKVFFIILISFFVYDYKSFVGLVPAALTGTILAGLNDELSGVSMMGDAGANLLGAVLGFWVAVSFPVPTKILALLFLIGIHIYTERYSISDIFDTNPILHFLDQLGRN